ncbi:acyltransferase [Clostridium sp. E02]|uniref:acyltransferase n=1 Tax=Clostridium sp. E02 TaxID=2487134 RepID=UPI000F51E375|nr:acyltransferase [Clostridium sp. E02]
MGKLQLILFAVVIVSCCLHIREQIKNRDHFLHLFTQSRHRENRIVYLDYLRLIATLFVILVHCLDVTTVSVPGGSLTWVFIQSLSAILMVCNYLFIMNSGALLLRGKTSDIKNFYYKRVTSVAIPFFCYYGIYLRLSCRYTDQGIIKGALAAFKDILKGPIDWAPHLWVIYVILSLSILAPFFALLLRQLSESMLNTMVFVILLFRCTALYLPLFNLSLNLDLMIQPWEVVFLLGYYFSHPTALKRRNLYWFLGGASCLFVILCVLFRADYKAILLADGAPTMIFIGGGLFLLLRTLEYRLPKPGFLLNFLIRYSYSILMVHWAILYYVKTHLEMIIKLPSLVGSTILSFFLVLVLSALSAILFDQTVVYCVNRLIELLTKWVQGVFTTHHSQ